MAKPADYGREIFETANDLEGRKATFLNSFAFILAVISDTGKAPYVQLCVLWPNERLSVAGCTCRNDVPSCLMPAFLFVSHQLLPVRGDGNDLDLGKTGENSGKQQLGTKKFHKSKTYSFLDGHLNTFQSSLQKSFVKLFLLKALKLTFQPVTLATFAPPDSLPW